MNILGAKTKKAVIYKHESHKLHQAFSVKEAEEETIDAGNPVMLNTDGTISNYDGTGLFIGIAMTPGAANVYPPSTLGKEITVAVRGYMIVRAVAAETIDATQYLEPAGVHATEPYFTYKKTATATETKFVALSQAAAEGDLIEILILN